jgi:hypothetical protein
LVSFSGDDDEQQAFLLDIDELERVGYLARGGVPCRLRRPEKYERGTYFHFRAEFMDGIGWDVIVPHSDKVYMQFGGEKDVALPNIRPKLICWQLGVRQTGMRYIFVKNIQGE